MYKDIEERENVVQGTEREIACLECKGHATGDEASQLHRGQLTRALQRVDI